MDESKLGIVMVDGEIVKPTLMGVTETLIDLKFVEGSFDFYILTLGNKIVHLYCDRKSSITLQSKSFDDLEGEHTPFAFVVVANSSVEYSSLKGRVRLQNMGITEGHYEEAIVSSNNKDQMALADCHVYNSELRNTWLSDGAIVRECYLENSEVYCGEAEDAIKLFHSTITDSSLMATGRIKIDQSSLLDVHMQSGNIIVHNTDITKLHMNATNFHINNVFDLLTIPLEASTLHFFHTGAGTYALQDPSRQWIVEDTSTLELGFSLGKFLEGVGEPLHASKTQYVVDCIESRIGLINTVFQHRKTKE